MNRHLQIGQIVLLTLFALGCGGAEWQASTQPVQGKITINGEAPAGAVVTLHPTGEAVDIRESKPWGVVREDGTYALRTYNKDDGAPLGEYIATVVWKENVSIPGSPDQLVGAYANPAKSDWKFSITEGQTDLPPIEITAAKVIESHKRRSRRPSPFEMAASGN